MKDYIVIPTYNEKENILALVPKIFAFVPNVFVLVADDNSPDGTGAAVAEMQKHFPHLELLNRPKKEGLGRAYLHAFSVVLKDPEVRTVTMMDADLSHDPQYLPEMLKQSQQFNVVTGSRYVPGGSVFGWELWRRLLSRCGNLYCRFVTRLPVHDCTSGFNVLNASCLRRINFSNLEMLGYAFIFELKYLLFRQGASFKEVPICFKNRTSGDSKISHKIISEGIVAPWKLVFKK